MWHWLAMSRVAPGPVGQALAALWVDGRLMGERSSLRAPLQHRFVGHETRRNVLGAEACVPAATLQR